MNIQESKQKSKKYFALLVVLVLSFLLFSVLACTSPNEAVVPNAFKITDYQYENKAGLIISGEALGTYTNNTRQNGQAIGFINWGDGTANTRFSPDPILFADRSGTWRTYDWGHHYIAEGAYTVTITMTAHFSTETVHDTFKKNIVVSQ